MFLTTDIFIKIFNGINYIYLTGELKKWNYVLYIDINIEYSPRY